MKHVTVDEFLFLCVRIVIGHVLLCTLLFVFCRWIDQDVLITNSYETAMRTAQNFLSVFLKK